MTAYRQTAEAVRAWWKTATGVTAGLAAIAGLWLTLGLPTPAFSTDVERLDRQSTATAILVYEDQLDRMIIRRGQLAENGVGTASWEYQALSRQIDRLQNDLINARARMIELAE